MSALARVKALHPKRRPEAGPAARRERHRPPNGLIPAEPAASCLDAVRPEALKRPRVILAAFASPDLTARNPDALVIDLGRRAFLRGTESVFFGGNENRCQSFWFCVALCCAPGGVVTREALIDLFWGADPEGGPLRTCEAISHHLRKTRPFARWAGLTTETRWGQILVTPAAPETGQLRVFSRHCVSEACA